MNALSALAQGFWRGLLVPQHAPSRRGYRARPRRVSGREVAPDVSPRPHPPADREVVSPAWAALPMEAMPMGSAPRRFGRGTCPGCGRRGLSLYSGALGVRCRECLSEVADA